MELAAPKDDTLTVDEKGMLVPCYLIHNLGRVLISSSGTDNVLEGRTLIRDDEIGRFPMQCSPYSMVKLRCC
jgi:hypothetical protein